MSEFSFIDCLRRRVVDRPPVLAGIGDDAALLDKSTLPLLVTTDMLMEGTDFTFPPATPQLAGRKSLAVNLSDIAAMAGRPTAAFVSLALPRSRGERFAEEFCDGLLALADEFEVVIAGGDTNVWDGPLVASLTVLGHPVGKRAVPRSGAEPGDLIFVTGAFGGSIAGHHLTFTPRVHEARQLLELVEPHAMIDVSDGLAADLHHVLAASRVGAIVEAVQIPIRAACATPTVDHALSDGEDFELLFTISAKEADQLERGWSGDTPVTCIGRITSEQACLLRDADGRLQPLPPLGWQHGW